MGRPPATTEDEILAAARAVFMQKGIAATTADVAARCGVSEATVFRRFPTKSDLFKAALIFRLPEWLDDLPSMAGKGDPHDMVHVIAERVTDFYKKALPLATLPLVDPASAWHTRRQSLRTSALTRLTAFFEEEHRLGRLAVDDPRFAARIFMGVLATHVLEEVVGPDQILPRDEAHIDKLVDLLWGPRRSH